MRGRAGKVVKVKALPGRRRDALTPTRECAVRVGTTHARRRHTHGSCARAPGSVRGDHDFGVLAIPVMDCSERGNH